MKLLIFGDVFGKLGRAGVKKMLPVWREKFSPDVVIANIENIAHGKGIGIKQIDELRNPPVGGGVDSHTKPFGVGVDIFTGGNHSLEGKDFEKILNDETLPILRPANFPDGAPGRGALIFDVRNKKEVFTKSETENASEKLLVINLIGQVFMKPEYASPFEVMDKILEKYKNITPYIILDWHADATSEKNVMGWYLDGKVSAVLGTHSHVPTADAKILPKGTAYISDIGMIGPHNSIIGVEIEPSFVRFKTGVKIARNPVESGPIEVNAVYLEISDGKPAYAKTQAGKAVDIKHLREIIPEGSI